MPNCLVVLPVYNEPINVPTTITRLVKYGRKPKNVHIPGQVLKLLLSIILLDCQSKSATWKIKSTTNVLFCVLKSMPNKLLVLPDCSCARNADVSACFSMILRPNFIYLAIFLIFQIWLSDKWHMFLWCDKLITHIYCCFTRTLNTEKNLKMWKFQGEFWTVFFLWFLSRFVDIY